VDDRGAVALGAAVLVREADAEDAELACPKVERARELAGLLPGVDVRHELAVDEPPQDVAEGGAVVGRDVCHAPARVSRRDAPGARVPTLVEHAEDHARLHRRFDSKHRQGKRGSK
jgi:hypothetical protein